MWLYGEILLLSNLYLYFMYLFANEKNIIEKYVDFVTIYELGIRIISVSVFESVDIRFLSLSV